MRAFHHNTRVTTSQHGIGLLEIMITMLLFVTVSAAAYKVYISATRNAIATQQESVENRKLQQFFETFRHQIENTMQLPNSGATVLQVEIPSDCVNTAEHPQIMGWGYIPFPGHDMARMELKQSTFNAIDPTDSHYTSLITPTSSDALRMVYLLPDTQVYQLAISGSPAKTYDTSQSTGGEPIVIASDGDPELLIGDFAIISDARRSDLFRITGISAGSNANEYNIEHNPAVSKWNLKFIDNYGQDVEGGAFIYKVAAVTYALDTTTNTLMADSHIYDDGFDGSSFVGGSPGLAMIWQPVASNISSFQVEVESIYGPTRTPMAGVPGRTYEECDATSPRTPEYCQCENQLGNPGIKKIGVNITYAN